MAVALDAAMAAGNSSDGLNQEASNTTSISSTGITVGASASLLIVPVVLEKGSGSTTVPTSLAATWNGTSMALGPSVTDTNSDAVTVAIFSLVNPAAGAKTLQVTWANSMDCYMSAVSFTGTDTVTGIQSTDNTTATRTTSITVPSSADGATVAVFGVNGAAPTVNFNKIFSEAPLSPGGGASYQLAGASNAHTFTGAGGTAQALAGVHVIAATAVTSTQAPLLLPASHAVPFRMRGIRAMVMRQLALGLQMPQSAAVTNKVPWHLFFPSSTD